MVNIKNKFTYFEVGNRKFKVERIDSYDYKTHKESVGFELTIFEDEKFYGTYNFVGNNAWGECLAEILSYSEITEDDYNAEHECTTFVSAKKGE